MSEITYRIRAESEAALIALLEVARPGLVVTDEEGVKRVAENLVKRPYPEMVDGEPVVDEETGETTTPIEPTGYWRCAVRLTEADAELSAISFQEIEIAE